MSGEPAALKSSPEVTPTGSRRYAVTCRNPAAALAEANHLPDVMDANLFGDRLHLLVGEALQPERLLSLIAVGDHSATLPRGGAFTGGCVCPAEQGGSQGPG